MGLTDIGSPSTVNIGIAQIAEEAGLVDVVEEIVAFGMGDKDILLALTGIMQDAMQNIIETWSGMEPEAEFHPKLNRTMFEEILQRLVPGQVYAALKLDVIRELVKIAGNRANTRVTPLNSLRASLDENGPAEVSAARDAGAPQYVAVQWTKAPEGYTSEIFIDLVRVWSGTGVDADPYEALQIALPSGAHSIRVLHVSPEGAATRFGPVAGIL